MSKIHSWKFLVLSATNHIHTMKKYLILLSLLLLLSAPVFSTTLSAIRSMYTGMALVLPANTVITGTIISDRSGFNTHGLSAFLQDQTGGISLRCDFTVTLNLNDSISVDVSGDTLTEFNGLLQIIHVDLSSANVYGNVSFVPPLVTVGDVLNNMNLSTDTWESTLVRINNVILSNDSSGIYNGTDTVTDATGTILMFTRSAATFANSPLPNGPVNITAYITEFFVPELVIRNISDVQDATGILFVSENMQTDIFPNPATGKFTIRVFGSLQHLVNITDLTGKIIYSSVCNEGELTLNAKDFARGMYTVQISSGKSMERKKLVVSD